MQGTQELYTSQGVLTLEHVLPVEVCVVTTKLAHEEQVLVYGPYR